MLEACLAGAAEAGAEVKKVRASSLKISGCRGCGGCDETGECVLKDGMQDVYPLLDRADRIVVASPMYFYSFPAQLKALMDRAQARWARKQLEARAGRNTGNTSGFGYVLLVGATRGKNLFTGAELTAKYFFDALGMKYCGGVLVWRVDEKGGMAKRPEEIERSRELGRKMVAESSCVEA